MKKIVVCVLSMHRSGSSAMAGALDLLGLDCGNPESLIVAKEDNPLGFWEQEPLQFLNDRLLRTLGRKWDTFAPLSDEEFCQLKSCSAGEMRTLFQEIFDGHPYIVWKDPRNLLLFPLWKAVLEEEGYQVKVVLGIRHPAAVAQSLERRNGIPMIKAVAMWMGYHARVAEIVEGNECSVVDYDRLLEDWQAELHRVFHELALPWPEDVPDAALDAFFRQDLRHNSSQALDVTALPFGMPVESLYREMLCFKKGGLFSEAFRETFSVYAAGSLAVVVDAEGEALAFDDLQAQMQALEKAYRNLEQTHADTQASRVACEAKLVDCQEDLESCEVSLAESETELDALRGHYRQLETWALHLQTQLKEQSQRVEFVSADLESLRTSWSWRLGAPLRAGGRGLRLGGRLVAVVVHEFPAAWRLLRNEGLRSLMTQIYHRIQQERALSGGEEMGLAVQVPEKKRKSAKQEEGRKAVFVKEQQQVLERFLEEGDLLDFTPTDRPRIAVVLVLYNRAELTFACLRSLLMHAGEPIELILINNASTDKTSRLLEQVRGATVVHNNENLHFLKACNQARDLIESEYLLLLNNDARLCEGAISAGIRVFEQEERVGAVGGKIYLLDGLLQEAGSIIWNDGSCLGYGRGADPDAPEYNFRREVDFCSGAFLLTPTKLFKEVGGFDERFAPAYYEETDYCMRLRALGYSTFYEPKACIEHFEFASSTEESDAIELQIRNREIFRELHQEALRSHFPPRVLGPALKARFATPARPRLLYIDDRIPHPELGSGFPRAQVILKMLVDLGVEITLIPLNFPHEDSYESAHEVVSSRVEVMRGWGRAEIHRFLNGRHGYYDVVWVSRPDNMMLVDHFLEGKPEWKSGLKVVYDAEAVFSLREKAKAQLMGTPLSENEYQEKLRKEIGLTRHADVIVSVSEAEADAFKIEGTITPRVVIPHAVELSPTQRPFSDRADLLFVGNLQVDGSPNVDSILWFIEHVWDSLRERLPELKLHVVGRRDAHALKDIEHEDIYFHDAVPDLKIWYERCRLFVAPTRFSAGIPLKVLDAAAHGVPAVVTGELADQLGWTPDCEVGVCLGAQADLAQSFCENIVHYYTQEEAWLRLKENALIRIRTEYTQEKMQASLEQVLGPEVLG
ncbi:glycosyltransferase [Kiritimatiellota bacterium B12222]|nr:glycosyltransferase [Kiritimatiellota bacterium B12222]